MATSAVLSLYAAGVAPMTMSDDDLMVRVRVGDAEAFAELVSRHSDGLVSYLTHLTGGREKAEDIAQEALLRAFTHADGYVGDGRFAAWLYRIATNLAYSEARRRRRWFDRVDRVRTWLGLAQEEAPDRRMEGSASDDVMQQAIARLPEAFRAALVLREIEGWSYAQVAEALGVPEGTVKSRVNRGKAMLKADLAGWWGEVDHV
jgi:RNA polymerase sigma-70 factor (ECF subfamily)